MWTYVDHNHVTTEHDVYNYINNKRLIIVYFLLYNWYTVSLMITSV